MIQHNDNLAPPQSVVSVKKMTVTPGTKEGLRSFARVDIEFARDDGMSDGVDSISVSLTFNVDRMTLDQVKDMAILHAKTLMNECVTDPHLKVGDERLEN
jgi:hypothetical protein